MLVAGGLVQEPDPAFRLIGPVFQQAGSCNIAVLIAERMGFAHELDKAQIVVSELGEHVVRRDVFGIVVHKALPAAYVSDRVDGAASDLAPALGNSVRHRKNLVTLFI